MKVIDNHPEHVLIVQEPVSNSNLHGSSVEEELPFGCTCRKAVCATDTVLTCTLLKL